MTDDDSEDNRDVLRDEQGNEISFDPDDVPEGIPEYDGGSGFPDENPTPRGPKPTEDGVGLEAHLEAVDSAGIEPPEPSSDEENTD